MGKNDHYKEKGIKILDPKNVDYTFAGKDALLDIKSSTYTNEKSMDSSKRSNKEKKDVDRLRYDIAKTTKMRTKGRIAGGQSKQGHSSVYE
jgi:hypothetical protein